MNRGLMAENMFLSQSALLTWLNSTLQLRLEKIEDTCNGALACQLLDILHPGSVNMKKLDFNVRQDYEYVNNYKELQQAFNKMGIDRAFSVSQLSKGKRQDNNEFMQWFKGYWDHVTAGQDFAANYDAVARRKLCKTGDWKKFSVGEGAPVVRPLSSDVKNTISSGPARRAPMSTGGVKSASKPSVRSGATPAASAPNPQLSAQVQELTGQLTELKIKVETAERERDFYFEKLRDVEILCQAPELADIPILKIVEKILYAADGNDAKEAMLEAQNTYGATLLVASPIAE